MNRLTSLLALSIIALSTIMSAQDMDRKIQFPDVAGYQTLICDFHIHTVFSDGHVWPTIRVQEAVKDGLDAISLTEHIEYQPWREDVKHPDRNRSYHIAKETAKPYDLLIIHGAEITRDMPPGHANALFVTDVNDLIVADSIESYRRARAQGAFIFWSHPHWIVQQSDAMPHLSELHQQLIAEDLLHGIEIVNEMTYSEDALGMANKENLVVMSTSDIHGLVDYQFRIAEGGHRPVTLVLATEKTEEAIKEALFADRTIAWFDNILAGKEVNMNLLLDASIKVDITGYIGKSNVINLELINHSDATFYLHNTSPYEFHANTDIIELPAQGSRQLQVITTRADVALDQLTFDVLNARVDYKKPAQISIDIPPY